MLTNTTFSMLKALFKLFVGSCTGCYRPIMPVPYITRHAAGQVYEQHEYGGQETI